MKFSSKIFQDVSPFVIAIFLLAALSILAILKITLAPFAFTQEEPHYISVAMHMWHSKSTIVLFDDNGIYLNKPPILFWLINFVWYVFGVNNWVFTVVPLVIYFLNLFLISYIYKILWPREKHYWIAGIILFISFFSLWFLRIQFDSLVFLFTLIANIAILKIREKRSVFWILFGVANGLGILSKGPVILIFTLVPALLIPIIDANEFKKTWFLGIFFSLLLSIVIISFWLLPLAYKIGYYNIKYMFLHNGLGVNNYIRTRAWWHYLVRIPGMLAPLAAWPLMWKVCYQKIKNLNQLNFEDKYCFYNFAVILVIMTCMPMKANHYFFPALSFLILFIAHALCSVGEETFTREYRNLPFILLVFLCCVISLFIFPFPFKDILINKYHIKYYPLAFTAVIGIIISFIFLRAKRSNLVTSLLQQLVLAFIMMILFYFTLGVAASAQHDTRSLAVFLKKLHRPVAYIYNYRGYLYEVGKRQLPDGVILRSNDIHQWSRQTKNGVIVTEVSQIPRNSPILFETPFLDNHHLIVMDAQYF